MGLFGFGKNNDVVDLAERYRKQKERENSSAKQVSSSNSGNQEQSASPFSFFDSGNSSNSSVSSVPYESDSDGFVDLGDAQNSTDRRRKLAKRILDMTTKLEDLSNQIYHLQQRMDVIEKKLNVRNFD